MPTDNYKCLPCNVEGLSSDPDGDIVDALFQGAAQFIILENALKTNIFDHIEEEKSTAVSIATLSRKHGYHPDVLERLLDNLTCMRLVRKCSVDGVTLYSNTRSASLYLCTRSPIYKGDVIQVDKTLLAKVSARLPQTIRTGPCSPTPASNSGLSSQNINLRSENSTHVSQNQNEVIRQESTVVNHGQGSDNANISQVVDSGGQMDNSGCSSNAMNNIGFPVDLLVKSMNAMAFSCRDVIPKTFDLSGHRQVVDLGGGTGYLAGLLTSYYDKMSVTVFELPHIVTMATSGGLHAMDEHNRISFVAGDFFQDELPPADLYILSRVLHTFNEVNIHRLLDKTCRCLPPGGKLLVLEKFLHESKDGPGYLLSLHLAMSHISEGRERTVSEYTQLVTQHGFSDPRHVVIEGVNLFDALLVCKPF